MKQRLADTISLVAQTPDLDRSTVEVAVTVPTFRRPDLLLRTLDSIAAQATDRRVAVIVMENDAERREGAAATSLRFEDGRYAGLVVIAHERGNCSAYNAGWLTALTQFPALKYVAVIDDDETASPGWIENLCTTAERFDCSLVGGPQRPDFETGAHSRWQEHPVFAPHHDATGPVDMLYSSGNLLVDTGVLRAMPQPFLDLRFNFTGGGDADFIRRSRKAGFRTAWCEEAPVFETVPARRVSRDWISKRALRNGALSAVIEHRQRAHERFGHAATLLHTAALLAASPLRAAIQYPRTRSLLNAAYPMHVAAGRLMSEFGYCNEQYRDPEQN